MPRPPRQRQMERQQAGAGNERAVTRRRWLRYLLARSKDRLLAGENFVVPELTRNLNIKLNMQVSLWPACAAISFRTGYPLDPAFQKPSGDHLRRAALIFEKTYHGC